MSIAGQTRSVFCEVPMIDQLENEPLSEAEALRRKCQEQAHLTPTERLQEVMRLNQEELESRPESIRHLLAEYDLRQEELWREIMRELFRKHLAKNQPSDR